MGRIASPARAVLMGDGCSRDLPTGLDDLPNRIAGAGAKINDKGITIIGEVFNGSHMGGGKVCDMDVVPHRGTIWRWVVGPEDGNVIALAERDLQHQRDQVGFGIMPLAEIAFRIRSGGIEIS